MQLEDHLLGGREHAIDADASGQAGCEVCIEDVVWQEGIVRHGLVRLDE